MSEDRQKSRPGHYEIIGETYAKVEFYEHGWNPYDRFLDVDKVDLILRKWKNNRKVYREIQVKYGTLFQVGTRFEKSFFDFTTWRFFFADEFDSVKNDESLFIAYLMSKNDKYEGDIFIFPVAVFAEFLKNAIKVNSKNPKKDKSDQIRQKVKVYISHSIKDDRWYLRKQSKFNELNDESVIDVTCYRRNFQLLD